MKCTTVKYFRERGLDAREVLEVTGQRPKWGHGARRDLKRIERQARHAFKDQQRAKTHWSQQMQGQKHELLRRRKVGRADAATTWKAPTAPTVVAILARPEPAQPQPAAAQPTPAERMATREARRAAARKAARRAEHEAKVIARPQAPPGTSFDAFLGWALRVALPAGEAPDDRLLTLWRQWW